MKLNCPLCKHIIPVEAVDFHLKKVTCLNCGHLFRLPERPTRRENRRPAPAKLDSLLTQAPEEVVVMRLEAGIVMQYWWKNWYGSFFMVVAIGWNVLVFNLLRDDLSDAYQRGDISEIVLLLISPFTWGGLALGYWALAQLINFTRISVNDAQLLVRHGPLPWFGNKSLQADEIVQIYSKETKRLAQKGKDDLVKYGLFAATKSRQVPLADGLRTQQQSLYFEAVIEKMVGIEDYPVPGEV